MELLTVIIEHVVWRHVRVWWRNCSVSLLKSGPWEILGEKVEEAIFEPQVTFICYRGGIIGLYWTCGGIWMTSVEKP